MAAQFPKILIADVKADELFRRKKYRKARKGDVIRIFRTAPGPLTNNILKDGLILNGRLIDLTISTVINMSVFELRQGQPQLYFNRVRPNARVSDIQVFPTVRAFADGFSNGYS